MKRALGLADGNPRLLEWLDRVLTDEKLDQERVLVRLEGLESDDAELRQEVLAQSLLEQVDGDLARLLGRAKVYGLPVPREAVLVLAEGFPVKPDGEGGSPLAPLMKGGDKLITRAVSLGLLEVSPDGGLRVPRVVPVVVAEDERETLAKMGAECLYQLWWESGDYTEAQALEIHRLAIEGNQGEIAVEIADQVTGKWNRTGRFRDVLDTCKDTLTVAQSHEILLRLAWAEDDLGLKDNAIQHYEKALEICPDEDETRKAAIIHNLAIVYQNQGRVDEAIALYQQSLELKEKIGDVQGKAATLHCIAMIYANQGRVDEAIALYQQSLELKEKIGDVQGKAATLSQLGMLRYRMGQMDEASALHQESLKLKEQIGNAQGKATSLHAIADIYANQGRVDEAIALYQQSVDIEEKIGNVQGKAATLHCIAMIYVNQGRVDEAIQLFHESLEIKRRIGYEQGQAMTLWWLGDLAAKYQNDSQQALIYLKEAFEILERIKSPDAQSVYNLIEQIQQTR